MAEKKLVWFDTDTGVDDAIALLTAAKLPEIEIVGISAVAGNAELKYTFKNARNVTYLAGKDYKVYKGAEKPLVKDLYVAPWAHGVNGLGNAEIPESPAPVETKPAWDALYEKAKELGTRLCIVAVGPLTNIALTLKEHPDFVDYCKEIYIMGGAIVGGNASPCAEFNIFADPHAAKIVFESGIHVYMFGLDVTHKAVLNEEDMAEIESYGNSASKLFAESNGLLFSLYESQNVMGVCEHDSCPIVYLAHPEFFKGDDCGVFVEADSPLTAGMTVCDLWTKRKFEDRHCTAFYDLDREKFARLIKDCYKQY